MNYNVIVLCLMFVSVSVSQNEDGGEGTNSIGVQTDIEEVATEINPDEEEIPIEPPVCSVCRCSEHYVDCSEREIKTIFEGDDWNGLNGTEIMDLDFSGNRLIILNVMPDLPINSLNLSRCDIADIEDGAFRNLEELGSLDLSRNQLSTAAISKRIFGIPFLPGKGKPNFANMQNLSLAYNDIHALPKDIFMFMSNLKMLDLSGNPLSFIDQVTMVALSDLKLTVLRLRECSMEEIPDRLLHTPRYLERLDLSNNKLTAVPQELAETKNLEFLNLNQNPIEELTSGSEEFPGFPSLKKLKELHMCNMPKLRSIGISTLAGLENLEKLHMSFNEKLSYIDPKALARPDDIGEMFDYPQLSHLYLQSNNLSMLDSRLIARWDNLQDIDVSDNPWLCDCTTQWMVNNLVPIVDRVSKKENATAEMACQEPIEMRGYNMKHLNEVHRDMRCLDKYGHRPEKDGAILLGTLIGVLLAVPIMLALVLMWRQGYFAWMGLRGPSNMSRAFYKRAPADDNYI